MGRERGRRLGWAACVGRRATKCGSKTAKLCLALYKTRLAHVHGRCETRRLVSLTIHSTARMAHS